MEFKGFMGSLDYLWLSEMDAFFDEDEADFMKDVFEFVSS